jgi:gliding motility-associated-like protein
VTITDSCGIQGYLGVGQYPVPLFESCASDSNIYVNPYFQGYDFNYDTLTFICTNCTPVQSATVISSYATVDTLFQHIAPGYNYNIVILSPDCGGDTLPFSLSQSQPTALSADYSPTSCYSFQVTAFPMLDSVILRDSTGAIVQVSYTGYFYQLPAGNYTASVYGDSASTPCDIDSAALYITLPFFASACETMMKDSTCQTSWQLTLSDDSYFYDTYSLIDGSGDTIPGIVPVSYYYNPLTYFFNLTPGSTYTLVSDSGCSMQYTLDPIPPVPTTAITYVPCVGLARILPSNQYLGIGCNNFYYNVYLNDSLVQYIPLSDGSFEVSDSGWYTIRWYAQSYDTAGNIIGYDTLCPVDTNLIYVSNSHVPYPYPSSAYVCDSNNTDTVIYHIYGGDIPYTVEVLGYDTVILNTNTGTFPTNIPGQYTMIVYDNCGISRSITFSVIDTCQGCPLGGISMPDTLYCAGDTVHLTDASLGAVAYEWYINGAPYSAARDTTFITPAGDYKILLLVYGRSGCQDSGVVRFTAVSPLSVSLGADTSYCDTFSRVLSTGIPSTVWSTGQTGAQITVTNPGRYSAMVFNKCGAHTDSVTITTDPVASLTLTPVQATICSDRMDTVILYAAVDSSLQAPFTFMWGGQTDSGVYSASYLVDSAGSYQVTVRDSFCSATRLAVISPMVCDSDSNSIARPSAFTPNGDQKNDVFFVPHTGDIYSFSLEIHDQWGQQVYQSTDVNQGWDGTYRGKPQPEGVYIWFTCDKLYSTSKENCTSGTVMLLR